MRRDHVEVARLTSELATLVDRLGDGSIPDDMQAALRRVLYGLHAVVQLLFAKEEEDEEEEVYLPLLDDHLDTDAADTLFADMERAARAARAAASSDNLAGELRLNGRSGYGLVGPAWTEHTTQEWIGTVAESRRLRSGELPPPGSGWSTSSSTPCHATIPIPAG